MNVTIGLHGAEKPGHRCVKKAGLTMYNHKVYDKLHMLSEYGNKAIHLT